MWVVRRPMGIVAYFALLALLVVGLWYLVPLVLAVMFLADASRQLDTPLWRLHGWPMRDEKPPPLPELPNLPLVDAVGALALAVAISLPSAEATWIVRAAVMLQAGIALVGWRFGRVIFRTGQRPSTAAGLQSIPAGGFVEARASGSLLTRDFLIQARVGKEDVPHTVLLRNVNAAPYEPRRLQHLPVRIASVPTWGDVLPDGRPGPTSQRLILLSASRQAGLSVARPDVRSLEPGTEVLPRSSRPAIRLQTVLGPLVLAFESTAEQAAALEAIGRALA